MKGIFSKLLIILFIGIVASAFGCAKSTVPKPQPPRQNTKTNIKEETKNVAPKTVSKLKPGDFFPLAHGYLWEYKGEGNEYASFNRKVLFTKGNLAQIRENNGGTVTASVYKTTPDAITQVFFLAEAYGETNYLNEKQNVNIAILKAPLTVGTKWMESTGSREIMATDATVNTPAGDFTQCIKVKISNTNSTVYEYYKKDIGLVKREFISGDSKITSSLRKFSKTTK